MCKCGLDGVCIHIPHIHHCISCVHVRPATLLNCQSLLLSLPSLVLSAYQLKSFAIKAESA